MSNSKDILNALVSEDAHTAKKLINEALLSRLGNALEEKLVEYAPTVFNEAYQLKGKDKKETDKKGKVKKGSKPDFLDLDKDGDKKESMKKASHDAKGKKSVDESTEVSDDMLIEEFQNELALIVQEIQEETGEELTDQEIQEIAEEYLHILESTEE